MQAQMPSAEAGDAGAARRSDGGPESEGEARDQVHERQSGEEKRKRKRDKAESAEDALLPHEPLARVMRKSLKPTTALERAAVRTTQVLVV